ncbi:MAG: putative adenylate-forming enzyme [Bacteroidia bacterium]
MRLRISRKIYSNRMGRLRDQRWRKLQKHLAKSDYYKKKALSDLSDFPKMDKSSFMKHFDQINTVGIKLEDAYTLAYEAEKSRDFSATINGITIGLSTGTSGNRGVFLASENERAMWVGAILDRVIGFSFKKRKVAFFLRANSKLYEAVKSKVLAFHFFDILNDLDDNLSKLNDLKPNLIVAQPSMLSLIADAQTKGLVELSPQKIISVAEVLTPEDTLKLETIFNQTIHQVYQCTEGFLAATCKFGNLHFNEDFLIIEKAFINADKTKFHPIITDLSRRSQPVIRYELNDIISVKETCPCASKHMVIDQIEGRSDDVFLFNNADHKQVVIFPDLLRRTIVLADDKIQDYALVQIGENRMKLYVRGENDSFEKAKVALSEFLVSKKINEIYIKKMIECPHQMGDKKRRIKNEYQTSN